MSELEKKAKTGNFIKDLALRYDSAKEHLWVRLEDALVPEKKLEELTQRLQQIVDNYSLVDDHGVGLVSKRRLEELLKEKIRKMKDNEIRLKVLKIRLDSLLRMPKGRRDETTIEKLREEITEIDEQLKKGA